MKFTLEINISIQEIYISKIDFLTSASLLKLKLGKCKQWKFILLKKDAKIVFPTC
jgi:hypothetical protein